MKNPRWNFALSCVILANITDGSWKVFWEILACITVAIIFMSVLPDDPLGDEHDIIVTRMHDNTTAKVKSLKVTNAPTKKKS